MQSQKTLEGLHFNCPSASIMHEFSYTFCMQMTILLINHLSLHVPTIVHQLLYTSNYCIAIRKQILNWRYTQKVISWHSNTSMRPNKSVWAGRSWSSIHCTSIKPSSDHLMLIKRSSDADYMIINPLDLDLNNLRTASPFKLRFLFIIILASSSALLSSLSSQHLSLDSDKTGSPPWWYSWKTWKDAV